MRLSPDEGLVYLLTWAVGSELLPSSPWARSTLRRDPAVKRLLITIGASQQCSIVIMNLPTAAVYRRVALGSGGTYSRGKMFIFIRKLKRNHKEFGRSFFLNSKFSSGHSLGAGLPQEYSLNGGSEELGLLGCLFPGK